MHNVRTRPLLNLRMLLQLVGMLLAIETVFMLVPLIVDLCYADGDWLAFAVGAAATGLSSLVLWRYSNPRSRHLGKREGFMLTAIVWVVFSIFGLIPFMLCNRHLSFTDAFFEAMAGFTTTGATVVVDTGSFSHGMQIWRALTQWIGGMGIILFTLAIIPSLNHSGGMQMFNAEVTGITHDKIRPRVSSTAKTLWGIYFTLTSVLVVLLWAGPMTLFESICTAFGTISTGGYTPFHNALGQYSDSIYVKLVITVFMFLGGVNFALIFKAASGSWKAVYRNDVFRAFVILVLVFTTLFGLSALFSPTVNSLSELLIDPLFQVVSIITSTGLTVTNFTLWGPMVLGLTLVMMFFGACAGSTSGGAKIDRILVLFKNARNELYRCVHPNAILSVKMNGKIFSPDTVNKVIAFLCIYVLLVVCGGLVLSAMGVPFIDSFFSTFSCISNTGFGAAVTGLADNFEVLPCAAKWLLSLLMLIGRLEIFTVLVMFTTTFWRN